MTGKSNYHNVPLDFVEYHDCKHIIPLNKNFVNIVEFHEIIILYFPIIIVELHKNIGRI